MEIENIHPNEIKRIQNIAYLTWPDAFKDILSKQQIDYMLNWMYNLETLQHQAENGHFFFIAKENNKDLGFIGIEPNYQSSKSTKIHKIYILPEAQGKGAGKLLFDFAENFILKNFQNNKLILNVNRFNRATEFYKYRGFTIVKEENIDIGKGYLMEDFVMEKQLKIKD